MPDDFDFTQSGKRKRDASAPPDYPLLTHTLCLLCVLITGAHFLAGSTEGSLLHTVGNFGLVSSSDLWDGKYYGLLTSFFVHLSFGHILFNMMWLLRLGTILETTLVSWKYFLFMVSACAVGSCCELVVSGETGAGASGVVYAMFGLLWAGRGSSSAWRSVATRQNFNVMMIWGLLCVVLTYTHLMGIANGAHWGGFAYGLGIGYLFYAPRRRPVWAIVLGALGAICVMSLFWMPWSWQWQWAQGLKAYDRKDYVGAIAGYEKSLRLGGDANSLNENIGIAWDKIAREAEAKHDPKTAADARKKAEQIFQSLPLESAPEEKSEEKSAPSMNPSDVRKKLLQGK